MQDIETSQKISLAFDSLTNKMLGNIRHFLVPPDGLESPKAPVAQASGARVGIEEFVRPLAYTEGSYRQQQVLTSNMEKSKLEKSLNKAAALTKRFVGALFSPPTVECLPGLAPSSWNATYRILVRT